MVLAGDTDNLLQSAEGEIGMFSELSYCEFDVHHIACFP
jgi:hypothetical protein